MGRRRLGWVLWAFCFGAGVSEAQDAARGAAALRVFLDCNRCDFDFLRREITFVNYVRDRYDAQVHVLVTTENSGGGRLYTLDFIGLEEFADRGVSYTYSESRTDTDDETREGLAQVLRVGFLHYNQRHPDGPRHPDRGRRRGRGRHGVRGAGGAGR